MAIIDNPTGRVMTQKLEEITYVKNGTIYIGQVSSNIQVESESDLSLFSEYTPGSIAHTKGWKKVWELGTDGTWGQVFEME